MILEKLKKETPEPSIYKVLGMYGTNSIHFAWCTKDFTKYTNFQSCKAYLQDHLHQHITGNYKFLDDEKCCLFIEIPRSEVNHYCEKILNILHNAEARLGFNKTVIKLGKSNQINQVLYVEADKRWMLSTPMISLFSLLIRSGPSSNTDEACETFLERISQENDNPDGSYAKDALKVIKNILRFGPYLYFSRNPKDNFIKDMLGYAHMSGISALGSEVMREYIDRYNPLFLGPKTQKKLQKLHTNGQNVEL